MKKSRIALFATTLLLMAGINQTASASASTKINFAKGSYCASYSGDFSQKKSYSIALKKGQLFEVKAANMEDGVVVRDSRGVVSGDWADSTTYRITTRTKGNHIVTVHSPEGNQTVQFCAY